jgi:hypothetical protein
MEFLYLNLILKTPRMNINLELIYLNLINVDSVYQQTIHTKHD